ncbi:metal-sulfur cluster assembly factor [Streptomyces sp. NPDC005531]|uniref:metal-sulfur cluster assembly factor n=1 Tax=Streptomyces sp. NPDC005531 TaxID=3364722 RepID=UPI00368F4F93
MSGTQQDFDKLRDEVVRTASSVMDPCSLATSQPRDLGEMGLIEEAHVSSTGDVTIDIVLTDPTCWFFADITQAIENAVRPLPGVRNVVVQQSEHLMWTPDRLTYRPLPLVKLGPGSPGLRRADPQDSGVPGPTAENPPAKEQGETRGL